MFGGKSCLSRTKIKGFKGEYQHLEKLEGTRSQCRSFSTGIIRHTFLIPLSSRHTTFCINCNFVTLLKNSIEAVKLVATNNIPAISVQHSSSHSYHLYIQWLLMIMELSQTANMFLLRDYYQISRNRISSQFQESINSISVLAGFHFHFTSFKQLIEVKQCWRVLIGSLEWEGKNQYSWVSSSYFASMFQNYHWLKVQGLQISIAGIQW